jgi:hypothetical protein
VLESRRDSAPLDEVLSGFKELFPFYSSPTINRQDYNFLSDWPSHICAAFCACLPVTERLKHHVRLVTHNPCSKSTSLHFVCTPLTTINNTQQLKTLSLPTTRPQSFRSSSITLAHQSSSQQARNQIINTRTRSTRQHQCASSLSPLPSR